uniref:Uncharacterized protein n=1 Tax=Solanum lycopersicum TaxID=4081 RepID=A0A3Q7IUX1_SOLLC
MFVICLQPILFNYYICISYTSPGSHKGVHAFLLIKCSLTFKKLVLLFDD